MNAKCFICNACMVPGSFEPGGNVSVFKGGGRVVSFWGYMQGYRVLDAASANVKRNG